MVDGKATELDITIGDRDFTIKQSPGVLQSKRDGGTTGAAVWECSVRFAEWLDSERSHLHPPGPLDLDATVLELGAGISGLVPLVLASRVERVVATDQQYALGLLRENIDANRKGPRKGRRGDVQTLALDWETDDIGSTLRSHGYTKPFTAVLACDCVFNYALIKPFVEACEETCKLGRVSDEGKKSSKAPALCIVAQQLRQPEVFQEWLEAFAKIFRGWRVPDKLLTERLKEGSGFVVHVGVLR